MLKGKKIVGFSKRLAKLRKAKGLTQQQLADKINVSRRVVAYYEAESDNPPGYLIVCFSEALNVSADELLGIKLDNSVDNNQPSLKLVRRMNKIESLSPSQQKFILKAIDSHLRALER
jgi:repressor LexA